MSWASRYIERLQGNFWVTFRPHGNSMEPKIKSGQLVTVRPVKQDEDLREKIVLCKVNGHQYLHLVSAIKDGQVQISNNKGHVNGWTSMKNVFGVLVSVED